MNHDEAAKNVAKAQGILNSELRAVSIRLSFAELGLQELARCGSVKQLAALKTWHLVEVSAGISHWHCENPPTIGSLVSQMADLTLFLSKDLG